MGFDEDAKTKIHIYNELPCTEKKELKNSNPDEKKTK